jgi:hypothetical protein
MAGTRLFFVLVSGILLLQAAWAMVVPPFRGLDEHDHAYKAAAVARGDWSPHHEASEQGWGELVVVPRDLVIAAHPICVSLPYTTDDNCSPIEEVGGGNVTVASSAARYNPVFYYVIGSAARPFAGVNALYAMRATAALLCAVLIGYAGVVTRRWARTRWPLVALAMAATPILVYSTAVAAPNGVEMAGALLVWCSLLGLASRSPDAADVRQLLVAACVGALPLVTVRALGPLWLLLILATLAWLFRRSDLARLLRRRDTVLSIASTALVIALAMAWTLAASTNQPGPGTDGLPGSPWKVMPQNWVLWVLQSIAAFPSRNEAAPAALYAVALLASWLLLALAWRVGTRRNRWVLLGIAGVASVVPIAFTVATYHQLGVAWQGRYGYPYALGFFLVAGFAIDRKDAPASRTAVWPPLAAAATVLTTQLIGQLHVLFQQRSVSPLAGTPEWSIPSTTLIVALTATGSVLIAAALTNRPRRDLPSSLTR